MGNLVVKLQGGLGNQLFILSAGFAYSLKLGCDLAVDLSAYEAEKCNPRTIEVNEILERKGIATIKDDSLNVFFEKSPYMYDSRIENVKVNSLLVGYFQSIKYFKSYLEEVRDLILSPDKMQDIQEERDSIAIHVRRGDYLNKSTMDYHGITPTSFFIKSARIARSIWGEIPVNIFSDTRLEAEKLADLIPHSQVFDDSNLKPLDVMIQMAKHKIIVGSNSSFSWWSALLGNKDYGTVFFPNKWNNRMEVRELMFSNWITLS